MQPQDPNNQNTNPTPPPTPAAPAPEPPQTPPVAPINPAPTPTPAPMAAPTPTPSPMPEPTPVTPTPQFGADSSMPPTPPAKKLPVKKLVIGIVGILVLIGFVVGIYSLFANTGPKLSDYKGKTFSIQYPEGFEKKDEADDNVTFVEKGDAATASKIGAGYQEFQDPIGQDEVDSQMASFKEAMQSNLNEFYGEEGITFTDVKVEDTTFQGQKALQATANVKKDGKDKGTIKYILSVNITGMYILFVEADNSDPAIKSATDEILNSFAIKL